MSPDAQRVHSGLLRWYETEKRDLPWRRHKDPYRIWLSEIMLQQTRVETVIPYFERFLSHFPTVHDLAGADLDRVANLWAGLGYYSRARNLHAAARQVASEYGGRFPSGYEQLRSLRGVGPYTAAAIASIAFGLPHCAIDGNLERVFSRLLALREDPKAAGKAAVADFGEKLVRLGRAGDLNQAVMDLSAKVCLPKQPRCEGCPVSAHCAARAEGIQAELPARRPKAERVLLRASAWAVVAGNELLLARRPRGSWLAGMWDIPWRVIEGKDGPARSPFGEERAACAETRTITKHRITFEVRGLYCARQPRPRELRALHADAEEYRWVPLSELHGIHLPRPSEKALEKILPKLN